MIDNLDPYTVLGVTPAATPADIAHAFRAKLRALHPDSRHADSSTTLVGDAQLQQLLAAYQLLRDPEHRAEYDHTTDLTGAATPQPDSSGRSMPRCTSPNPQGPVEIRVTYRCTRSQT